MLINVKMPMVVGILTSMSMINFMLLEKCFITQGQIASERKSSLIYRFIVFAIATQDT